MDPGRPILRNAHVELEGSCMLAVKLRVRHEKIQSEDRRFIPRGICTPELVAFNAINKHLDEGLGPYPLGRRQ